MLGHSRSLIQNRAQAQHFRLLSFFAPERDMVRATAAGQTERETMTENTRTARCSCGQLRVTVTGEPTRVSVCHCLECQKRTGSPFGSQARWPMAQATIEGPSNAWSRTGDEGHTAEFHFCPVCSSIVWYRFPDLPDVIAIPIGGFADPDFPPPQFSVYDNRRHRWLKMPDGIEVN
jgi:hypothetical protein